MLLVRLKRLKTPFSSIRVVGLYPGNASKHLCNCVLLEYQAHPHYSKGPKLGFVALSLTEAYVMQCVF